VLGGAQPQPNGLMWLLAGSSTAKTLQELNVTTGKIALIVPESASAVSVAQLSSGSSVSVLQLRRPDPLNFATAQAGRCSARWPSVPQ